MQKQRPLINRTFTKQQDQSDCGIACLLSILKFHGGTEKLEKLRELSGTSIQGTTLLGLYQCANKIGLDAEGFEAGIENLKDLTEPCILHVHMDKHLEHYVIFYPVHPKSQTNGTLLIGDPGRGIVEMSEDELKRIWQSKTLLMLKPNKQFIKAKITRNIKQKWFINLLKEDYPLLAISIFLGIIIAALSLSTAVFSQKLVDDILPKGHIYKLSLGLTFLFLLLIIRSGLAYLRQHFLLMQSRDFNTRITGSFYKDLLYLPKSFFDHRKTGDMIARMNDTMRIQKSIAYITGSFFIDLLIVIISGVYLFSYSGVIASITLLSVPLMILVCAGFHKSIIQGQQEVMVAYSKNESNYVDTIQGINTIKEANKETFFAKLTKSVYVFFQDRSFSLGRTGNKFGLVTEIISTILILSILAISSLLVLNKQFTIGQLIAVSSIAGGLVPSVARLALTNLQIQEAKIAFDRMYEFASVKPEYIPVPTFIEEERIEFKSLKAQHISFRFPGRKPIIRGINFYLKKGELIALLGESGCGKSTILQLLQKFYLPENGQIKINGQNINQIYTPSWRSIISTVPQEIKIFNGTLLENITFGSNSNSIDQLHTFCVEYGFDKYFLELPQAYLTLLGEEGVDLSGGQKQLVTIARALYRTPQILLLDEPTSGMDRSKERFILNLLLKLKEKMSVILVTHRLHTVKWADRIYLIEKGKISTYGDSTTLLLSDNFYSKSLSDYETNN